MYTCNEAEFLNAVGTNRFSPCSSKSPLQTDFTSLSPLSKSGLKLVCNVKPVCGNLKSENLQDDVYV